MQRYAQTNETGEITHCFFNEHLSAFRKNKVCKLDNALAGTVLSTSNQLRNIMCQLEQISLANLAEQKHSYRRASAEQTAPIQKDEMSRIFL